MNVESKYKKNENAEMSSNPYLNMTVREFFEARSKEIASQLEEHTKVLTKQLQDDLEKSKKEALSPFLDNQDAPEKSQMVLRIKAIEGPHKGAVFIVKPQKNRHIYIGRSTNDKVVRTGVSLSDDMEVSTNHAKIFLRKNQVILHDSQSMNGTYVNGVEIHKDTPLSSGDQINVGATVLIITFDA